MPPALAAWLPLLLIPRATRAAPAAAFAAKCALRRSRRPPLPAAQLQTNWRAQCHPYSAVLLPCHSHQLTGLLAKTHHNTMEPRAAHLLQQLHAHRALGDVPHNAGLAVVELVGHALHHTATRSTGRHAGVEAAAAAANQGRSAYAHVPACSSPALLPLLLPLDTAVVPHLTASSASRSPIPCCRPPAACPLDPSSCCSSVRRPNRPCPPALRLAAAPCARHR